LEEIAVEVGIINVLYTIFKLNFPSNRRLIFRETIALQIVPLGGGKTPLSIFSKTVLTESNLSRIRAELL